MSDNEQDRPEADGVNRAPPYISFATLLTFLKGLKADGVPPQIDKSVLSKLSGGVQGQMKLALRSLGLMDGDVPTPNLVRIVEAYDTSDFEAALLERLHATYPYVFKLDLMTATPTMLADAFKVTGAKEDVLRKCRTFFLHAAKRAGVPMGNRILTGSVPRATPNGVRRKPKLKSDGGNIPPPPPPSPSSNTMSDKALEYKLVDLMKEDDVEDDERNAIWTLIQYLTRKAKASQTEKGD